MERCKIAVIVVAGIVAGFCAKVELPSYYGQQQRTERCPPCMSNWKIMYHLSELIGTCDISGASICKQAPIADNNTFEMNIGQSFD